MSGQAHNKLDYVPLISHERPTTFQSKLPQLLLVLLREKRCDQYDPEAK